jgi:cell volume regulation protein A
LPLDSIVLVARAISGGRVNVVGLRLPEDEDDAPPTRISTFKRKLGEALDLGRGDLRLASRRAGIPRNVRFALPRC